jgi:hypothetical protein
MIGGVSFGETPATALGIPFVLGVGEGISRARYYPDFRARATGCWSPTATARKWATWRSNRKRPPR